MHITKKYFVETKLASFECHACKAINTTENNPDKWKCFSCGENKKYSHHLDVSVMRRNEDGTVEKVGEYKRKYHTMYHTFFPFRQDDREYALVSINYTGTAVISLPDCNVIINPDWENWGFCPTGFYVPSHTDRVNSLEDLAEYEGPEKINGQIGFVCGCVWGDDGSWKIQVIDLSQLKDGKISIEPRFGYCQSPYSNAELCKAITLYKSSCSEAYHIDVTSYDTHTIKLNEAYKREEEPTFTEICDIYRDRIADLVKRKSVKITDDMSEEDRKEQEYQLNEIIAANLRHFFDETKKIALEQDL